MPARRCVPPVRLMSWQRADCISQQRPLLPTCLFPIPVQRCAPTHPAHIFAHSPARVELVYDPATNTLPIIPILSAVHSLVAFRNCLYVDSSEIYCLCLPHCRAAVMRVMQVIEAYENCGCRLVAAKTRALWEGYGQLMDCSGARPRL